MNTVLSMLSRILAGTLLLPAALPAWAQNCGDVLTTNTVLRHDLVCPGGTGAGYALAVRGVNVVLDLNGYTIDISSPGASNFDVGVLVEGAPGAIITNGLINAAGSGRAGTGIEVRDSEDVVIEKITIESARYGIHLRGADGAIIEQSQFLGGNGPWGIVTDDNGSVPKSNAGLRMTGNYMDSNGAGGSMFILKGQSVDRSVIEGNNGIGLYNAITVWAVNATGLRISENRFTAHANFNLHGLYLAALNKSFIDRNEVSGFTFGIFLHEYCCGWLFHAPATGGTFNRIEGNTLVDNETGVGFGIPPGTGPQVPNPQVFVEHNRVLENRIENSKFAFQFGYDTRENDARSNTLVNVSVVARDLGQNNSY